MGVVIGDKTGKPSKAGVIIGDNNKKLQGEMNKAFAANSPGSLMGDKTGKAGILVGNGNKPQD